MRQVGQPARGFKSHHLRALEKAPDSFLRLSGAFFGLLFFVPLFPHQSCGDAQDEDGGDSCVGGGIQTVRIAGLAGGGFTVLSVCGGLIVRLRRIPFPGRLAAGKLIRNVSGFGGDLLDCRVNF